MIKNYFFLKHIIDRHDKTFENAVIVSVFTQTKNEIVFETSRGFLLINFDKKIPYIIFKEEFHRRNQSMNLVEDIYGNIIQTIKFINDKRVIGIELNKYKIILNLFYGDVGMTIYNFEKKVVSSFKSEIPLINQEPISNNHLYSLLHHEIAFRSCSEESFINELLTSEDFYLYKQHTNTILSNIELTHLNVEPDEYDKGLLYEKYNDSIFYVLHHINQNNLKSELNNVLSKQKRIYEATLKNINENAKNKQKKETYENYGHLIMSNIYQIKPRQQELLATDWSSNEEVKIKLNPDLTPHQNAENYYRKAKGAEKNQVQLGVRKEHIESKLDRVNHLLDQFAEARYTKQFEKIKKVCISEKWIQPESNKEKRLMQGKSFNYYEFEIDGHEVVVGKDAKSNDYLSLKYSKANDYWFHVQGSPGSHVILKWHGYKDDPEKTLLKKVASLTAYYSKMKNAGNIPVIYTQSKYVKKPRGAKPGAVTVQKEKSIFVQPKPIEELK